MSVVRRNKLPVLRAPYDTTQEYNAITVGSPRERERQLREYEPPAASEPSQTIVIRSDVPSRLEALEERIYSHERNTQGLIERALKIREDVVDSLNYTQGTWQEEKQARVLLQEHIRTITAVVNRLNADIATLEESIKARDGAAVGTNNAVKNLEVHHVASLTDLRGRIVRCDTSIAKLSTDIRGAFESIRTLNTQQQEMQSRLMDRMHGLESQLVSIGNQLERISGESRMKLQHLEGDTSQQMSMIDAKTRQMIEDLRNSLASHRANTETELDRLEARLQGNVDKAGASRDVVVERLEKRLDETQFGLEARLQRLEEALADSRSQITDVQVHLENKILSKIQSDIAKHTEDIARLKKECREGFATVHESISNMKSVVEGKRKLLEDQLRKEIGQIRKMVVLV